MATILRPCIAIAVYITSIRGILCILNRLKRSQLEITYSSFLCFYRFFVLNSYPMSTNLKNVHMFLHSRSKVNFKVKYDLSTNQSRNTCNTSFSHGFDWAIHFRYYLDHLRSFSRSNGQCQGHTCGNMIISKHK